MELSSAIMGAIFIALCVLPFIIMSRNSKKRGKQMLQYLNNIALQHNGTVSQHEFCGNFGIGIDETNNFVFFFKKIKGKEVEEQFIDLADIQITRVIETSRIVTSKGSNEKVIDKLELVFIPLVKNKPEIILEFFNADVYIQLFGELQAVEKWSKIINDRLKNRK